MIWVGENRGRATPCDKRNSVGNDNTIGGPSCKPVCRSERFHGLTDPASRRIVLAMKVTYYVEVLSSWCHWVEPVWNELKIRYAGRADFEWKIALMSPGDFPVSQSQCDWFYERSGGTVMRSLYKLNSGWFEAERKGHYEAPN